MAGKRSSSPKRFGSFQSKLQAYSLLLGLLVITTTYWQASSGAVTALRQATQDRLMAIRETKRHAIEDFFQDLNARVLALSTDESTVTALEQFGRAWKSLPPANAGDPPHDALLAFYRHEYGSGRADQSIDRWLPTDSRARALQHLYIVGNSHPTGSKELLLDASDGSEFSRVHSRYHPTFHRYLTAFNFHDIFLIDGKEGRILYTVAKEIDLGMKLTQPPYEGTGLARVYRQAMAQSEPDRSVITDYSPYMPSHLAPAAFVATPVWRAGAKIGVIAVQVSIDRVNRVMTGDRNWQQEGLGDSGQTYITSTDGTLRSDLRFEIEDPAAFLAQLRAANYPEGSIERIRRNKTAILNLQIPKQSSSAEGNEGPEVAQSIIGVEVIRSHAPLRITGLDWTLIAEMDVEEAFAPVVSLQRRLMLTGIAVASLFIVAAWVLSKSITRPVLALAEGARRLGGRDFDIRLPVESTDEIGQLAASFNEMTDRLKTTTVSRDELDRVNQELHAKQRELQDLSARLIHAQEEERARLARELHDDLTQRLAALAIAAGTLRRNTSIHRDDLQEGLERIQHQLVQISEDVHGLSRRLHSRALDDLGLTAAIEGECRGFFERTGVPVDFRAAPNLESLGPDVELALYRIVQEALRNVARHSGASEVELGITRDGGFVTMTVKDNGRGFDTGSASSRTGLGLASMGERARLLGGDLTVQSNSEGTRLVASVPETAEA